MPRKENGGGVSREPPGPRRVVLPCRPPRSPEALRQSAPGGVCFSAIEFLFDFFLTRTSVRVILILEQEFYQGGIIHDRLDAVFHSGGRDLSDGGVVTLDDTTILDVAMRILGDQNK